MTAMWEPACGWGVGLLVKDTLVDESEDSASTRSRYRHNKSLVNEGIVDQDLEAGPALRDTTRNARGILSF